MGFMCPGRRWLGCRWHWLSLSQSPDWICGPALPGRRPGPALNLHWWLEDAHEQILASRQKPTQKQPEQCSKQQHISELQWGRSKNKRKSTWLK